jgi:hypothetical protein
MIYNSSFKDAQWIFMVIHYSMNMVSFGAKLVKSLMPTGGKSTSLEQGQFTE